MTSKPLLDEPVDDVLIEGAIHKTMLFFCIPERWPGWRVVATAVFSTLIIRALWSLLSGDGQAGWVIAVMQSVFVAVDTAVLYSLPRRQISFGPWKAQLMALSVPRFVVTLAVALLTLWLAWPTAVLIALLIQMAATAAYAWGLFIEIHRLSLTHLTVTTDRLPADGPPIRLLHITDLHIERLTKREEKVLSFVRETAPDLIVITGDYVNLS
jgi:hypothetical protein